MSIQTIGGVAGAFLIAGLVTLGAILGVIVIRWIVERTRSGHSFWVSGERLVWTTLLLLAILDVVVASAKLLYPTAELKVDLASVLDFVKAALWPITILVLVNFFRAPIATFLGNIRQADFDVAGNKVSLQAQVQEVSAKLSVAEAQSKVPAGDKPDAASIVALARNAVSNMGLVAGSQPPSILWIDDQPLNNKSLVASFVALGMNIDQVLDTEEGLAKAKTLAYDLIIEDMGRPSGKDAGYDLLDDLKMNNIGTPVIIFAARMGIPDLRHEAINRGAIAATNRPSEVFRLVTSLAPRLAATRK